MSSPRSTRTAGATVILSNMARTRARLVFLLLAAEGFALAQRAPIVQQLTFAPDHASGIYDVGETVGWTVTPGPVDPTFEFKWTIRRNNAVALQEGKLDLSSGATDFRARF